MIKIYVSTSTRAEYGLMKPLIRRMSKDEDVYVKLLVSGTHLSMNYGHTIDEIKEDGYADIHEIEILSEKNDANGISETMSNAILRFSEFFSMDKPDYLLIDGDRYESLAIVIAAVNNNIPIIHNGGGCTTEGATDEYYRHAITKMSMLHFTSTETYRRRIIQMGERPDRVFNVGSLGIENIKKIPLLKKNDLEKQLGVDLGVSFAVLTYHPVTLEQCSYEWQVAELLAAIEVDHTTTYVITGANADSGGERINELLRSYCSKSGKAFFFDSLGMLRYLSALKYCDFVIGNSSSGLIEAPSFHIPTVNIGDRQKGRLKADSIIDCKADRGSIIKAIHKALDKSFRKKCENVINPNGDGNTSKKILTEIKKYHNAHGYMIQKEFYDLPIEEEETDLMNTHDAWETIHSRKEWGGYPSEHVIRFVARNYYKLDRSRVKILDFGCGTGANTWFLAREGFDTYAFDISESAIKILNMRMIKEGLTVSTLCSDGLNLPYRDNYFDAIIDNVSIFSNPVDDIRKMYVKCFKMLVSGGKLMSVVFDKNTTGFGTGKKIEPGTFDGIEKGPIQGLGMRHFFDKEEFLSVLSDAGFNDIRIEKTQYTDEESIISQLIGFGVK